MNRAPLAAGALALLILAAPLSTRAQVVTQPSTAASASSQTSSDESRAYIAANAIDDPKARLDALRKFQADYPGRVLAKSADTDILGILLTNYKDRTNEIGTVLDSVVANLPAASTADVRLLRAQSLAGQLLDAGILLDRARGLMRDAIAKLDRPDYIKRMRDIRQRAGALTEGRVLALTVVPMTPSVQLSDETLGAQFDRMLGGAQEVLGRIDLATGDTAGAEREFRSAVTNNPQLGRASLELSKIESARGNDRLALDLYLTAVVTAKLKRAEEDGLVPLYRKVNGDSGNLERDLDRVYRERFSNPIAAPEPFAGTRGGRVALLEMFTGSACGPCVAGDLALDRVLQRYPADAIAVLAYHVHVPAPDPMTVPDSVMRKAVYAVPGVPAFNVDGVRSRLGGGPREMAQQAYDTYAKSIDASLATPAEAQILVTAAIEGDTVRVHADVRGAKPPVKQLRLHLVLAERELTFAGENGIRHHPFVVRDAAGNGADGLSLPFAESTLDYSFDLATVPKAITKSLSDDVARRRKTETSGATPREFRAEGRPLIAIDRANLVVVAFVQEAADKALMRSLVDTANADDEASFMPSSGPVPAYRVLQAVWTPVVVRR